jgi:mannose-6-phosphate isomerase-like protein (cupin superfamily)
MMLPAADEKYAPLLQADHDSVSMRSGFVRLFSGESVGLHSTGANEELVIPLSGTGELRSPGFETLPIHYGCVLYNPPNTPHDVVNMGEEPLCYIYVVVKAQK